MQVLPSICTESVGDRQGFSKPEITFAIKGERSEVRFNGVVIRRELEMRNEPTKAYVYQPMPPQEDGKFYGVGGLHQLGVDIDHRVKGITKADAQKIAEQCNQKPADAAQFIEMVQDRIDSDWRPECGCRFESIFSNAVLLCAECSELPCHNRGV